jgi:predicted SnoaL-like aldol condensation-catalyzing enzyme
MATPEENKELARRFVNAVFNDHDADYAMDALSDDFVEHQPMPGMPPDKKGTVEQMRFFLQSSPDIKAEIHDLIASGDRVAIRATYTGTDAGGFLPGMAPTNKRYSMEGMDIVRWGDDGKVLEHWGIVDAMSAMGQLGLLPPPAG